MKEEKTHIPSFLLKTQKFPDNLLTCGSLHSMFAQGIYEGLTVLKFSALNVKERKYF